MPEVNQGQPKQLLLIALVLLLFVIVCVQAWHMADMENQLEANNVPQPSTQLTLQDETTQSEKQTEPAATEEVTNNTQSPNYDTQAQHRQSSNQTQSSKENIIAENEPFLRNDDYLYPPFNTQSWHPYDDIRRMQQYIDNMERDMDRVFNERYNRAKKRPEYQYHFSQRLSVPKINVREDDNQYMVFVKIPGTDEDDISVNLEGQRLTIKAKQGYEKRDTDPTGNITFRERRSGKFKRSITLREPVDQNGMKTRVDNGVLIVMIPKIRW